MNPITLQRNSHLLTLYARIARELDDLLPGAKLRLAGSVGSGLGSQASDVDLDIVLPKE